MLPAPTARTRRVRNKGQSQQTREAGWPKCLQACWQTRRSCCARPWVKHWSAKRGFNSTEFVETERKMLHLLWSGRRHIAGQVLAIEFRDVHVLRGHGRTNKECVALKRFRELGEF